MIYLLYSKITTSADFKGLKYASQTHLALEKAWSLPISAICGFAWEWTSMQFQQCFIIPGQAICC